jgi:hypothetical protein
MLCAWILLLLDRYLVIRQIRMPSILADYAAPSPLPRPEGSYRERRQYTSRRTNWPSFRRFD